MYLLYVQIIDHRLKHQRRFCKSVTIINRSTEFSTPKIYIEKLDSIKNIKVLLDNTPVEFVPDKKGCSKD